MFKKFIEYVGNNFRNPNGIGGKITTKIMNIMNQKQYKAVLDNLNFENNDVLLDIGFGNGYLINKLLKKNNNIKIFGIDISKDMVNIVSKIFKKHIDNNCLTLLLENLNNKTTFKNEMFNKIYTVNTIYFWDDLQKCFSEIKRILKPNGIFINAIYTKKQLDKTKFSKKGFNKYTKEEIIKITEENGMTIKKIIEIKENISYCIISEYVK